MLIPVGLFGFEAWWENGYPVEDWVLRRIGTVRKKVRHKNRVAAEVAEYMRAGTLCTFPWMAGPGRVPPVPEGPSFGERYTTGYLSDGVFVWREDAPDYIVGYGLGVPEFFTQWCQYRNGRVPTPPIDLEDLIKNLFAFEDLTAFQLTGLWWPSVEPMKARPPNPLDDPENAEMIELLRSRVLGADDPIGAYATLLEWVSVMLFTEREARVENGDLLRAKLLSCLGTTRPRELDIAADLLACYLYDLGFEMDEVSTFFD